MRVNTFGMLSNKKKEILTNKIKEKNILFENLENQEELVFVSSMQGTLKDKLESIHGYSGYYNRVGLFQSRSRGNHGFTFARSESLTSYSSLLFQLNEYGKEIKNDFAVEYEYGYDMVGRRTNNIGSEDEELTVFFVKTNALREDEDERKKLGTREFVNGMNMNISLLPMFYIWNGDKFYKLSSEYSESQSEKVSFDLLKLIEQNVVNVDYDNLDDHEVKTIYSKHGYNRYVIKIRFNDIFTKGDIEFDKDKQRYSLNVLDNLAHDIEKDFCFQVWAEKVAGLNKKNYRQIIVNDNDNQNKLKRIIDSDFEKKVLFLNKKNFIFEKKDEGKKQFWPLRNKIEFKIKTNFEHDDYYIYHLRMKPYYTDDYENVELLSGNCKDGVFYCIEILKGIYCLTAGTVKVAFDTYNIEEINCRDRMYSVASPINYLYAYRSDIPNDAVLLSKECYSLNDMDKDELTFNMNLRNKWTNAGYKTEEISLIVSDFFVFLALIPNKVYYESGFKDAVKNNIEEVKKLIEENDIDDLLDSVE